MKMYYDDDVDAEVVADKTIAVIGYGSHRSDTQQIYSLSPLATRELPHIYLARSSAFVGWSR